MQTGIFRKEQTEWRKLMNHAYVSLLGNASMRSEYNRYLGAYQSLAEYGSVELHLPRQCGKTRYLKDMMYRVLRDKPNTNIFYITHNSILAKDVIDELSFALNTTKENLKYRVKSGRDLREDQAGSFSGYNFDKYDTGGDIIIFLDEVSINRFLGYAKKHIPHNYLEKMKVFSLGTSMR